MAPFEIRTGTPGLALGEIAHVLIPGRGRDATGRTLSPAGRDRVRQAHALYVAQNLGAKAGRIICSGYKTPTDTNGERWSPPDAPDETFVGVPEADSMRHELLALGTDDSAVRVERHSIDTVTNFLRVESGGHFGDDRPVAIVAQESHLSRMLEVVAPRTLRREYLGVVVPESGPKNVDHHMSRLVSRVLLFHITPETPGPHEIVDRRIRRAWHAMNKLGLVPDAMQLGYTGL